MHKLFLLYLMEYIREARGPPGRLKGGSVGRSHPPPHQKEKVNTCLGLLTEAETVKAD